MVARMNIGGILLLAAITLTGVGEGSEPSASLPEMLDDAEVRDIFFLDADRGWAVGDRGVLLRTSDGGRNWQLSDSPVNCRLESVHFVDEAHGWAVGGWTHPYTHQTTGVVLATRDGGQRWERVPHLSVPMLTRVHFQDRNQGRFRQTN